MGKNVRYIEYHPFVTVGCPPSKIGTAGRTPESFGSSHYPRWEAGRVCFAPAATIAGVEQTAIGDVVADASRIGSGNLESPADRVAGNCEAKVDLVVEAARVEVVEAIGLGKGTPVGSLSLAAKDTRLGRKGDVERRRWVESRWSCPAPALDPKPSSVATAGATVASEMLLRTVDVAAVGRWTSQTSKNVFRLERLVAGPDDVSGSSGR